MDRERLEEIRSFMEGVSSDLGSATHKQFWEYLHELLKAAESMVYMQERFPAATDQIKTFRRESTAEWKEEE